MKFFLIIFTQFIAFAVGECVEGHALDLYVIHPENVDNMKHIENKAMGVSGFIKTTPDVQIKCVSDLALRIDDGWVFLDNKKWGDDLDFNGVSEVVIDLDDEHVGALNKVLSKSIGGRILLILDGKQVAAPEIRMPLKNSTFGFSLGRGTNAKDVIKSLKLLMKQEVEG